MSSLREIKDHIGSVRSTLKITGAMKLVASAKLRKAQQAVEGIRPYTRALSEMLEAVMDAAGNGASPFCKEAAGNGKTLVVAVAGNSSLCGAFNANVIRVLRRTLDELEAGGDGGIELVAVGRKVAEAVRRWGYPAAEDYGNLVAHPSFEQSSSLAQKLLDAYSSGRCSRVILVYNHFVSSSSQSVRVETYLPFSVPPAAPSDPHGRQLPDKAEESYILEPSRDEILTTLLPLVMRLRIHAVILDSTAAEHAARTIAMQAASDNAEDLLAELTLEYNKGRQQKITAEILDLAGGAQQ